MPAETVTEVLTSAQMRAIEEAAIAAGDVTGAALMEAAGQAVADAILARWPVDPVAPMEDGGQPPDPRDIYGQKKPAPDAVVLCGPGNNGGDGFVVARVLIAAGWAVSVFLYGDAARFSPDARLQYDRCCAVTKVRPVGECLGHLFAQQPVVVDALFGTGLARPLPEDLRNLLMATVNCPRVAVDVPSFLSADTGRAADLPPAHLTVTFHRPKLGHFLADGPQACGALIVADIGLAKQGIAPLIWTDVAQLVSPADVAKRGGHKYDHGHALVLCGGVGKGGAGRLAAAAALRVGAGAVTLGAPPAAMIENAARLDAVMLQAVQDAASLVAILDDPRLNALCLGPALGRCDRAAGLVRAALRDVATPRFVVLDADALRLIAADAALFDALHDRCVLTPHAGEFAALFPDLARMMAAAACSKLEATQMAAKRAGCVILLKGPDTVIATPQGQVAINAAAYENAAPWLATAGSGDVLAGFITGLLARGLPPFQAAQTGAWLHMKCALSFGPGLIAEDLADELPKVFRSLGL